MISKHHDINFVQIPPRTATKLVAKRKDTAEWYIMRSAATDLHLSLSRGRTMGTQALQAQLLTT